MHQNRFYLMNKKKRDTLEKIKILESKLSK